MLAPYFSFGSTFQQSHSSCCYRSPLLWRCHGSISGALEQDRWVIANSAASSAQGAISGNVTEVIERVVTCFDFTVMLIHVIYLLSNKEVAYR